MYEQYWGLTEKPFRNTPDPKYLYSSSQHEDALMKLTYAVTEGMGAAMLTGVFGCGKTLIGRALLRDLGSRCRIAFITNPRVSDVELLRSLVRNLKAVELPDTRSELSADALLEQLQEIMLNNLRDGSETVVIVDEAHTIERDDVFEQLRMLLNFQQNDRFLLTMILCGQPELADKVANLKQLAQRIAIRCHLDRLDESDMKRYIAHRLSVAGRAEEVFRDDACEAIYRYSDGIPRRINHVCDLALLTAFGKKADGVDRVVVDATIADFGL